MDIPLADHSLQLRKGFVIRGQGIKRVLLLRVVGELAGTAYGHLGSAGVTKVKQLSDHVVMFTEIHR